MPAALPYSKHTPGRTFIIAISVLGIVALTQVGMLGWAFVKRVKAGAQVVSVPSPVIPAPKPAGAVEEDKGTLTLTDPFEDKDSTLTVENSTEPIMPPERPRPMPRLQLAPDSRTGEILQNARAFREHGDMSNALARFREAYGLDPRNPEAIAEIAVTFEKMGLPDKAAEHWRRVYDMGESAGVYFSAAQAKMREAVMTTRVGLEQPANSNVQTGGGTAATATFGIGAIESEDLRDPKFARRLVLKVPIEQRIKTKVSVKELFVQVLFYDLLDDKPLKTSANTSHKWTTMPLDWRARPPPSPTG